MSLTLLSGIQLKVLEVLKQGPFTRDEICEALGFFSYEYSQKTYLHDKKGGNRKLLYAYKRKTYSQRTTILDNLQKLEKKGIVKSFTRETGKVGRPKVFWGFV